MKSFKSIANFAFIFFFLTGNLFAKTPNIILIFMDDMGYGDLSVYGSLQYNTPQMDRLANEGIRFTNFLSAQAVCSASRAGLLAGCYPNRIGFHGALSPNSKTGIHPDEILLSELLLSKGYHIGMVGKWHLGDTLPFLPLQNGFKEYFGLLYSNDMWPVNYEGKPATDHRKQWYPPLYLVDGNEKKYPVSTLDDQAQLTGRYTERAVEFIHKNKDNPFFLYVAHSMPHVPINASAKFKGKSRQGLYGDMMMELDWSVGEILKALSDNAIEDNTLVILTSDNGPWLNFGNHAGLTGGLREGKGTSFEGGQRVPCIMRWKGKIKEGQIFNGLASTLDIYPTIAELCSVKFTHSIDGISMAPVLNGFTSTSPRDEFYYYYRKNSLEAVRWQDWKLILPHPGRTYEGFSSGADGMPGPVTEEHFFPQALYDLRRDPGERYDVQQQHLEVLDKLLQLAEKARNDLGDDIRSVEGKNRRPAGKIN